MHFLTGNSLQNDFIIFNNRNFIQNNDELKMNLIYTYLGNKRIFGLNEIFSMKNQ